MTRLGRRVANLGLSRQLARLKSRGGSSPPSRGERVACPTLNCSAAVKGRALPVARARSRTGPRTETAADGPIFDEVCHRSLGIREFVLKKSPRIIDTGRRG